MRERRLLHRLAAANPVPLVNPSPDRDAIFAQIVAAPADHIAAIAQRQRSRTLRLRPLSSIALAGTVVAGMAAVAVALTIGGGAGTERGLHITGPHMQETAYIVAGLRKSLAATTAGDAVLETTMSDSTGVNGGEQSVTWSWTDPQTGFRYWQSTTSDSAGNPTVVTWDEIDRETHHANGQVTQYGRGLTLEYGSHTYLEGPMSLRFAPAPQQPPGLLSTTTEIAQALENGTVSQTGKATINGRAAIALSVTGAVGMTLYVDAQTDQPLRMVISNTVNRDNVPITTDLRPATESNIANTREPSIPAGFTPDQTAGAARK